MTDYQSFADAWPGATQVLRPPLQRWVDLTQAYEAAPPDGLLVALGTRWYRAACFDTVSLAGRVGEGLFLLPEAAFIAAGEDDLPLMVMVRDHSGTVVAAPEAELPPPSSHDINGERHLFYPRDAFWQLSNPGVTS